MPPERVGRDARIRPALGPGSEALRVGEGASSEPRTFTLKRADFPMEHGPNARTIQSGAEQLRPGELVRVVEQQPATEGERLYECPSCVGTGSMESSDSTDDSWWDCTRCGGTGKLKDRRAPIRPRTRFTAHPEHPAMAPRAAPPESPEHQPDGEPEHPVEGDSFAWPQWWRDGKLGRPGQLRQLVHDLHGRAVRAEMRERKAEARTVAAVVEVLSKLGTWGYPPLPRGVDFRAQAAIVRFIESHPRFKGDGR